MEDLYFNLLPKAESVVISDQVAEGFIHLGLENLKNGDYRTSLNNLLHCLAVLVKKFPFVFSLNLFYSSLCPVLLLFCHSPL